MSESFHQAPKRIPEGLRALFLLHNASEQRPLRHGQIGGIYAHLDCTGCFWRGSSNGVGPRLCSGRVERFHVERIDGNWGRHGVRVHCNVALSCAKTPREFRANGAFSRTVGKPNGLGGGILAVAWAWACAPEWRSAVGLALDHPAVLFGVATLALGYASNPITGGRGWRDIPRLKWPVIALAWGLVTGWLPLQFLPSSVALGEWAAVESIGVQTLFVAGITLPFDVRDLLHRLGGTAHGSAAIGCSVHHSTGHHIGRAEHGGLLGVGHLPARAIAGAVALVGIVLVPSSVRHEWIFSLWLDGCLILQGVLAFLLT